MKKMSIIFTILLFFVLLTDAKAKKQLYDIQFDLGNQGKKASSIDGIINIKAPSSFSGLLQFEVVPFHKVIKNTSSTDLILTPNQTSLSFTKSSMNISFKINFNIGNNGGEYFLTSLLSDDNGKVVYKKSCFILVENEIFFYGNFISSTIYSMIRYKYGDKLTDMKLKEHIDKIFIQRNKKKTNNNSKRISNLRSVNSGDTIDITMKWTYNSTTMPVKNARVIIYDTESGSDVEKFSDFLDDNGKYEFQAWKDNPKFKLKLLTEFEGISGKSKFSVKRNTDPSDTTAESVAFELTESYLTGTSINYTFSSPSSPTGSQTEEDLSALSVFHGVQDIFRTAYDQLSIEFPTYSVYFASEASDGSQLGTFVGPDRFGDGIYIIKRDRYDWDVLAHELGHVVDKTFSALQTSPGGDHSGANQYDLVDNGNTYHNKEKSFRLAFSEAFATFWGVSLNQYSKYKGKINNIGDSNYDDTEDASISSSLDSNSTTYKGDDTEDALQNLLWDIYDSGRESYSVSGINMKDNSSYSLNSMWLLFKGGNYNNVFEFWKKNYLTNAKPDTLTEKGAKISPIFCNFGVAPILTEPKDGDKIDPADPDKEIKLQWKAGVSTMNSVLVLDKFQIVFYKEDYSEILWKKDLNKDDPLTYTFSNEDREELLQNMNDYQGDIIAVIFGLNDGKDAASGQLQTGYFSSNAVRLATTNYDHFVVGVVDSSGSNDDTDPNNLRIVAAKQTINRLTSFSEANSSGTLPDLSAAIDFDSSVTVLHDFDDPDIIEPVFSNIDSEGGTDIAAGIYKAIELLDNIVKSGLTTYIHNRAAIFVFTDGENNDGIIPVIESITAATLKGIRVHYGFLQPRNIKKRVLNANYNKDREIYSILKDSDIDTIEEAVIASGGVYGTIADAASQIAFVNMLNNNLTNVDSLSENSVTEKDLDSNIQIPAIVTNTGQISCFTYRSKYDFEKVRIMLNTDDFSPEVWVTKIDTGKIFGADYDDNNDGNIDFQVSLENVSDYYVYIGSQNSQTGKYNIEIRTEDINMPMVITDSATNVTPYSATINALINPNGNSISKWYFEYGKDSNDYQYQTSYQSLGSGNQFQSVTIDVRGLTPHTNYYYRIVAISKIATVYGEEFSFLTSELDLPIPIANAGNNQIVKEGETVTLDATNSTTPEGLLSYKWYILPGPAITLSNNEGVKTTFVAPPVSSSGETITFILVVTNTSGFQSSDEITITIEDNGITGFPEDVISFKSSTGDNIGIKTITGGSLVSLSQINPDDVTDNNNRPENLTYGLIDIKIKTDKPGEKSIVKIYLPKSAPVMYKWYKYQINKGWNQYDYAIFNNDRNEIELTFVDGNSSYGDDDGLLNGIISDPSGLGLINKKDNDSNGLCFLSIVNNESLYNFYIILFYLLLYSLSCLKKTKKFY